MLLRIERFQDIDGRKLMDLYSESNQENTDHFYPDETDKALAVKKVEAGFLEFLKNDFFTHDKSTYWILAENETWISALRTNRVRDDLYYMEALETRPDFRKRGYGSQLLAAVIGAFKLESSFRLCDCVRKTNIASLKTHETCGFRIVSEEGYDYLSGEKNDADYSLEYRYPLQQGQVLAMPNASEKADT